MNSLLHKHMLHKYIQLYNYVTFLYKYRTIYAYYLNSYFVYRFSLVSNSKYVLIRSQPYWKSFINQCQNYARTSKIYPGSGIFFTGSSIILILVYETNFPIGSPKIYWKWIFKNMLRKLHEHNIVREMILCYIKHAKRF